MSQEQLHKGSSSREEDQVEELSQTTPEAAEHKEELDQDIDSILDEIDDVLETNAEDFVKGFIQKGGQ